MTILDSYVTSAPHPQNAIEIFKGEWATKLPPPYQHVSAGQNPLFEDGRLLWGINQLGGVYGHNILELGPLEGGHSYLLERGGAGSVTAIESNTRAYLKCLITKEIAGLKKTRFLCGDFLPYLESCDRSFDTIIASGVLYHMKDPLHLLELLASHTDRLYLWTHYFDDQIIAGTPYLQARFCHREEVDTPAGTVVQYRHDYLDSLQTSGYCGGNGLYSTWLSREGILTALRAGGFNKFRFGHEMPHHPHGPCLSMIAVREQE